MSLERGSNSLFFSIGIDQSNLKKDTEKIEEQFSDLAKSVEKNQNLDFKARIDNSELQKNAKETEQIIKDVAESLNSLGKKDSGFTAGDKTRDPISIPTEVDPEGANKGAEEVKKIKKEIESDSIIATLINNTGLREGTIEASGILETLSDSVSKSDIFGGLAIGAVAAFYKICQAAYTMSAEFETAMKEVQTISAATQKDYEGMSSSLVELSKKYPQSAKEMANAFYEIVSAGYDGAAGLNLLEVAAKSAVGGVTDVKTASDGLTSVLNAWGIAAENAGQVSDVFFKTVELGKTTFPELSKQLSNVAPLAASMGISFEEVGGAIATMTKMGTPTSVAITQIRAAIESMTKQLGDGWRQTMTFQEGVQKFVDKAGGSQNTLSKMAGSIEAVGALLALSGKNAQMAASDYEAMNNSLGSTDKAYAVMMESIANQGALFANNLAAAFKPLGDVILNTANLLFEMMNSGFNSDGIKSFLNEMVQSITFFNSIEAAYAVFTQFQRVLINLRTYTDDVNKSFKNFEETTAGESAKMNTLFDILDKTNVGTQERKKAIETINTQYKEYLPYLLTETTSLNDVAFAQIAANDAMQKSIALKIWEESRGEITKQSIKDQQKLTLDLISTIKEKNDASVAGVADAGLVELVKNYNDAKTTVDEFGKTITQLGEDTDALGESQKSVLIEEFSKKYNVSAAEVETSVIKLINAQNKEKDAVTELDNFYSARTKGAKTTSNTTGNKTTGGNGTIADPKVLNYLDELEAKLKKAQEAREKLSDLYKKGDLTVTDELNIAAAKATVDDLEEQIKLMRIKLGLQKDDEKNLEIEKKHAEGSIGWLEEKLSLLEAEKKEITDPAKRSENIKEIAQTQEKLEALNKLYEKEKDIKNLKKDIHEMSLKELLESINADKIKLKNLKEGTQENKILMMH